MVWGGNFVVARVVHADIPPVTLAFWRWAVAFVVIAIISAPHIKKDWPVIRKHYKFLAFVGVLSVGLFNTLVYYGAHTTEAHNISIIASTSPIWILLMASIANRQGLSLFQVIGNLVAIGGAVLVIVRGDIAVLQSFTFAKGDFFVLTAAIVWALYCVLLRYKPASIHSSSFLMALVSAGLLFLLPFYGYEYRQSGGIVVDSDVLLIFTYLGVGASVIAWYAWNESTYVLGAQKTGVIYYTMPLFTGASAIIFLGEAVHWFHAVGFLLVIGGIQISRLGKQA
jgi:drug/metabolite transporter (DMT)-like permease